ncbi:GNAT family N-acetyltransferase [Lysobacter sp. TAB13]|jgi:RimJ/RimL family protein N-acetyltransferase|uniref:GNAT family N-acetyltransferase n=1 Tax=Lysobacter sp. TAB13 TaxID=3233065 RepID=UPI003F9A915E
MTMSKPGEAIAAALAALEDFPLLQGPRVRLRGPREDERDAQGLFAVFGDEQVMRYWSRPPMQAMSEAHELIAQIRKGMAERNLINWVIADGDDAVIGSCTLFRFDANHRRAELGYALHPAQWGLGIAREAATLALDWAFDTLGLHRCDAGIDPANAASRALLHRLGFVTEGVQRESFFVGERVTDSELLGLLVKDWRAARSRH